MLTHFTLAPRRVDYLEKTMFNFNHRQRRDHRSCPLAVSKFLLIAATVFPRLLIAENSVEKDIAEFSSNFRTDFRPVETTFQTLDLIEGTEQQSVCIETGDYFIYEDATAICAANPDYSFFLERENASDSWNLKSLKPKTKSGDPTDLVLQVQLVKGARYGCLNANSYRIDEYLELDESETRVARSGAGRDENVRLVLSIANTRQLMSNGRRVSKERITATFIPEKYGWMPIETEAYWPKGNGRSLLQNREFELQDGFWVPRETEKKIFKTIRDKEPYVHVVTQSEYRDTEPDFDRFMVSHYGFKEPVLPGAERSRIGVVIGIGAFLLFGFLLFKKFEKRSAVAS